MQEHKKKDVYGWLEGIEILSKTVDSDKVIVGNYSYYGGYYHEGTFLEKCVRYADSREDSDKLIIGRYCQIGSGVIFNIGANTRHNPEYVTTYPFYDFAPDFSAPDPYRK